MGPSYFFISLVCVCVCLLLQDLVQSCLHGGGGRWEDMCYERRRAEACVCLLLQYLILCVCLLLPSTKLFTWGARPNSLSSFGTYFPKGIWRLCSCCVCLLLQDLPIFCFCNSSRSYETLSKHTSVSGD
jgi:hypothetical protein